MLRGVELKEVPARLEDVIGEGLDRRSPADLGRERLRIPHDRQHIVKASDDPEPIPVGLGVSIHGRVAQQDVEQLPRLMVGEQIVIEQVGPFETDRAHPPSLQDLRNVFKTGASDPAGSARIRVLDTAAPAGNVSIFVGRSGRRSGAPGPLVTAIFGVRGEATHNGHTSRCRRARNERAPGSPSADHASCGRPGTGHRADLLGRSGQWAGGLRSRILDAPVGPAGQYRLARRGLRHCHLRATLRGRGRDLRIPGPRGAQLVRHLLGRRVPARHPIPRGRRDLHRARLPRAGLLRDTPPRDDPMVGGRRGRL